MQMCEPTHFVRFLPGGHSQSLDSAAISKRDKKELNMLTNRRVILIVLK
jgi:hypothetical protein